MLRTRPVPAPGVIRIPYMKRIRSFAPPRMTRFRFVVILSEAKDLPFYLRVAS